MKNIISYFLILFLIFLISCQKKEVQNVTPILVIHGGAGNISKERMNDSLQVLYKNKLEEALKAGYSILENGGTALDAVEKTINVMENSPLFNSGFGSVLTSEGKVEMDASIMNGRDLNAGAVASVSRISNPISLARLVMEKTPHVLLVSTGAEKFAQSQGIHLVDPDSMIAPHRLEQWKKSHGISNNLFRIIQNLHSDKYGTVGAVALDKEGHLAAGTSTGGLMNKMPGRVGDSPIIGAGTYADDQTCALSATGQGEYFIRLAITHEISSLMKHKNFSLKEAAHHVIFNELNQLKGSGGVIGLDHLGNIVFEFNTQGMFRGYIKPGSEPKVFFFGMDEDDIP